MLTNYHTIAYITGTLAHQLAHRTIEEAFTQERDQLVLRFSGLESALVVSCDRFFNTMYLRPGFARARANTVDVLKQCFDQSITGVRMHPMDRVMMVNLSSGWRIDVLFFGAKANVLLLDEHESIVDAFKDRSKLAGGKAEYRTGEIMYDVSALRDQFSESTSPTMMAALKTAFPSLGSTLVQEVLHRAGVAATANPRGISDQETVAMQSSLASVLAEIGTPHPRVYLDANGKPVHFSLMGLQHVGELSLREFSDVHEAVRVFMSASRLREFVDDEKRGLVGKIQQRLSKTQRAIDAVQQDVTKSACAEEYQRCGDLILLRASDLKKGDHKFLIDAETEIPIAKELSPIQNAQRYFEKAKRSRLAHQQALDRVKKLRATATSAERLLSLLDNVNSKEELKSFVEEHKDELEEFGVGKKVEQREQLPFRIFVVEGGFEVWAGKSSKNNDELTLKYAKPNDLWFHARGSSGSHVVLKINSGKGEPSKRAKEQAAGIAAYYSKMKNAKMVPVAMTEKKYVRKPKGAAPGSVMVEREKVLFAEPALPEEGTRQNEK